MDVKALAKSKRAHSSHHSKKHQPNRTTKAASAAATTAVGNEKLTGKHVKAKTEPSHSSTALPSNWSRYEEEDLDAEIISQQNTNTAPDVVMPKSRGADYAYLVSEAKAQSQTKSASHELSSFDDVLDDMHQDLGPMLTVRGQNIMSLIAEDYFELKDEAPDKYEASFLSLNLNALAKQLAKANLAERLFIEPDLLPPEMNVKWQESTQNKYDQDQVSNGNEVSVKDYNPLCQTNIFEEKTSLLRQQDSPSSSTLETAHVAGSSENRVNDNLRQYEVSSHRSFSKSTSELNTVSVAKRQPNVKALAAAAELDMLLGSFSETKFIESSRGAEKLEDISSSRLMSSQTMKKGLGTVGPSAAATSLDDDIDELLKETSTFININGGSASHEVKEAPANIPSVPNAAPKSKLLDDFDTWLDTV